MSLPGRPYPARRDREVNLRRGAAAIIGEIDMPTPTTVSERIRANRADDAKWAKDVDARLDVIDEKKKRARPILEREVENQEFTVRSLEDDANAMEAAAKDLANDPTPSSPPSPQGSDDGQRQNGPIEAKPEGI